MRKEINEIPEAFWKTLSDAEWKVFARTNTLSAQQSTQLWKTLGKTSLAPERVQVLGDVENVRATP